MPNKLKSASWLGGHFEWLNVVPGQVLKKGDIIGLMGDTGHSNGIHLHGTAFKGKLTTVPYQADNLKHGADRKLTQDFHNLPGLLVDRQTKKPRKAERTYGWLGYPNHYAEDLIAEGRGVPLVAWPLDTPGVVGMTRYFGDKRFGKTVVIWFGTDYLPEKPIGRGRIRIKQGLNIRSAPDINHGKVVGHLPYNSKFDILEEKRDGMLMKWYRMEKGWVKVEGGDFVERT